MNVSLARAVVCVSLLVPAAAAAQWEFLAPFPKAMTEIVGVASEGKLYVVGGLEQGEPLGLMEEYDERANRWIDRKKMPVASHHVMVAAAAPGGARPQLKTKPGEVYLRYSISSCRPAM